MCKTKRTYVPVAINRRPYKLYMEDLKSISKLIKKQRPRVPAYDGDNSPKADTYTDGEL